MTPIAIADHTVWQYDRLTTTQDSFFGSVTNEAITEIRRVDDLFRF